MKTAAEYEILIQEEIRAHQEELEILKDALECARLREGRAVLREAVLQEVPKPHPKLQKAPFDVPCVKCNVMIRYGDPLVVVTGLMGGARHEGCL